LHRWLGTVLACIALAGLGTALVQADELGDWAVQPGMAGDPLPAVGHSLFDQVFAAGGRYEIPYPFERLVQRIEAMVQPDVLGKSGVKRVLIPLGRSLQRSAGAPEFFRFPRVVVAVDGEPRIVQGRAPPLLKDRLFIGYHEKAAVLEIISYNESAGRFEFQLIKEYRAGAARRRSMPTVACALLVIRTQGPSSLDSSGTKPMPTRVFSRYWLPTARVATVST